MIEALALVQWPMLISGSAFLLLTPVGVCLAFLYGLAVAAQTTEALKLSPWQERAMLVPEMVDLFFPGGRAGGKSVLIFLLAMRHCRQHGADAAVLICRLTFPGLQDLERISRWLCGLVHGSEASYNGQAHVWRMPGGGTIELGCLSGPADWPRYQGRSFTMIAVDECQQFPDFELIDLLRSCLRGPAHILPRMILAANPGGPLHAALSERHVYNGAEDWQPYLDERSGRSWVRCPSTLYDNDFIDKDAYETQLRAATATDLGLQQAWIAGDWSAVTAGAFFANCLSAANMVEPWPLPSEQEDGE